MIYYGTQITVPNDNLQRISTKTLYERIKNPAPELLSKINQLRTIISIDPKQYQRLKISLPYFTCACFNPPFRKKENFAAIKFFVVDIDHIQAKNKRIKELKGLFMKDDSVHMLFTSPSNDGLKVMYMLEEPFYDAVQYSMFYKLFVKHLAIKYMLEQVIDAKTSDVSRCCFLSVDPDIYFNETSSRIVWRNTINFDDEVQVSEAQKELHAIDKEQKQSGFVEEKETPQLNDEQLKHIKEKLGIRGAVAKPEKKYYIPDELEGIIQSVEKEVNAMGIKLKSVSNISYGKKFVFELGFKWAEINIFYGKRGYSVVITPKSGSNSELADVVYTILKGIF